MTRIMRYEDGYRLWLRYDLLQDPALLEVYRGLTRALVFPSGSIVLDAARQELEIGLEGLLGARPPLVREIPPGGALVVGTVDGLAVVNPGSLEEELGKAGEEGFAIVRRNIHGRQCTLIAANRDVGVLYGVFHFLRHLQTRQAPAKREGVSAPRVRCRVLDHWDNIDRSVERGYAGLSLWDWSTLPEYISPRYRDYARANASVGINGAVLTNVNESGRVLRVEYLDKTAALASAFRPYGIRVYLTACFSAPMEIGGLSTADPLEPEVGGWWRKKVGEIYRRIPDFGGFLVKANSEGRPGPEDYGRTHAEGANLLADSLAPYGGRVMWRAFVYRSEDSEDRAKQAFAEFKPLDGRFRPNVLVQVKNGPVDFQPREPFHPLFGGMSRTPLMLEFQLTQEYLGFATHLVFLGPLFKETLDADTHCRRGGSTVSRVVDGSLHGQVESGIAGVANIGNERNWCGHPFAAANWYAFGRLAWDHALGAETVADEWIRMTFSNDERVVGPVRAMMLGSREAAVDYMTPLGLHHLMGWGHHHGPAPWIERGRRDWTSVYYHRADKDGIGFDRSPSGSDAVSQYNPPLRVILSDAASCPEELLLWFHHVAWDYGMKSGHTLWDELCRRYQRGVEAVGRMRATWNALAGLIDDNRLEHVCALLMIQEKEAVWWRDACLAYFQGFSGRGFPEGVEPPAHPLDYYIAVQDELAP